MKAPLISPSLLSADFCNLERDIAMLNSSNADWYLQLRPNRWTFTS